MPKEAESFESIRRREEALQILENPEMLIWLSNARDESVPQTRYYFERVLAGLPDEEPPVFTESAEFMSDESAALGSSRKGKQRASLGAEGGSAASSSAGKRKKGTGR